MNTRRSLSALAVLSLLAFSGPVYAGGRNLPASPAYTSSSWLAEAVRWVGHVLGLSANPKGPVILGCQLDPYGNCKP